MPSSFSLRFFLLLLLSLQVWGDNSIQTFRWKFGNDYLSRSLAACFQYPITVMPTVGNLTVGSNFSGIPPYYMMAFPEYGQPITTYLGNDNNTLSWTPRHPIGSRIILQVVDSTGSTGGTSPIIYEIIAQTSASSSQGCIAPPPPGDFTISSNVTGNLETCQPWRLNINGGVPPYTVVLDARNSPVITNVTVPYSANALVYINRADPNTELFASVVDSVGRWANGTQVVSTVGSTDYNCIGLSTLPWTQEELNAQEAAARKSAQGNKRRNIIIGVVVGLLGGFLLIAVATWLFIRRRRSHAARTKPDLFLSEQSKSTTANDLTFEPFPYSPPVSPPSEKSSFPKTGQSQVGVYHVGTTANTTSPYHSEHERTSSGVSTGSGSDPRRHPSFASFPANSVRRKAAEAAQEDRPTSGGSTILGSNTGTGSHRPAWSTGSTTTSPPATVVNEGGEIIIQHQDGGTIRELPPPYPNQQST